MKINDINRLNGIKNGYQQQVEFRKDKQALKKKDEVQISQAAQEMLEVSRAEGTERAERIQQLKHAVEAGTYHVEAKVLAEKLLPFFKS